MPPVTSTPPPISPGPGEQYTLSTVMAAPPPKRRSRLGLWIGIAAVAVVAAAGTALFLDSRGDEEPAAAAASASPATNLGNPLRGAAEACDSQHMGTRVEDNGQTLIIDNTGRQDSASSSVDLITLRCLLGRLSTPAAIVAEMEATRALDGRQQAEWDRYSASWSYHPNTGLDLIVTLVS